ncbi:MAG: DUF4307 domain-containing protein [Micropruina sp.]|uniref:DUF4307 domain-containing protein n=1 Tax=Micropruina sp. TaxID=2737536 RepID=UPI0039E53830
MSSSTADRERIRRRYPPKRMSPVVITVVGVVIVALVGYVIWVAAHRANPPVTARIDTFAVVSDTEMQATLVVDRPDPAIAVKCFLIVQAVSYERVGERWIDVPSDTEQLTRVPVSLRTFKRGTSISVDSCGPA